MLKRPVMLLLIIAIIVLILYISVGHRQVPVDKSAVLVFQATETECEQI